MLKYKSNMVAQIDQQKNGITGSLTCFSFGWMTIKIAFSVVKWNGIYETTELNAVEAGNYGDYGPPGSNDGHWNAFASLLLFGDFME